MKILHISDLHFDPINDGLATKIAREKLKEYFERKNIINIDHIFVAGDFRDASKQKGHLDIVASNVVQYLLDIAGWTKLKDKKNIHIVPGNHDFVRNQEDKEILKKIYDCFDYQAGKFKYCKELEDLEKINGEKIKLTDPESFLKNCYGFFEKCVEKLGDKIWTNFKEDKIHRRSELENFNLLYINTSIGSGLGAQNNLLTNIDDFYEILKEITNDKPIFILAHNPIEHLREDIQKSIKRRLNEKGSPVIWFCGDTHVMDYDNTGKICTLTVSSMIEEYGSKAGFLIIDMYDNEVSVEAHIFDYDNDDWEPREALSKQMMEAIPESIRYKRFPLPRINNIPEKNKFFTERGNLLEKIHDRFQKKEEQKQYIAGSGGMGKTQLAYGYAFKYSRNYKNGIWVIDSSDHQKINGDFKDFAKELGLYLSEDPKVEDLQVAIKSWLIANESWLLIFDNLKSKDDILGYIPVNSRYGNYLATSQNQLLNFGTSIELEEFTIDEAVKFLDKRNSKPNWLETDVETKIKLAKMLGCFPLAMEQAAAYISNVGKTYAGYINLLKDEGLNLFASEATEHNKANQYEKTVLTTWEISFKSIRYESSRQLLYISSYLASNKIPISLFKNSLKDLPKSLKDDLRLGIRANEIITELRRYSQINREGDHINIHSMVQKVVKNKIKDNPKWLQYCLDILSGNFYFEYGNIETHKNFENLLPHAEKFLKIIDNENTDYFNSKEKQKALANLYISVGYGNNWIARYSVSLVHYHKALKIVLEVYGESHLYTAIIYKNIGGVYSSQGKYEEALDYFTKALKIRKKSMVNLILIQQQVITM